MNVVLIAVVSLDGRITRPGEPGPGFASPGDQRWFREALRGFDCCVMGRKTFDAIPPGGPEAATRLRVVMTRSAAGRTAVAGVEFSAAAPAEIVAGLRARGFHRCALLGGGQIYAQFLDAGLVDAMWLTLEPVVLGGGTPLADGIVLGANFTLTESRRLSHDTLLLHYQRAGRPLMPLPPIPA
jgi:dihydrofolate reductase